MSDVDDESRSEIRASNRIEGLGALAMGSGLAIYVALAQADQPLWWGTAAVLIVGGLIHLAMTSWQIRAMEWSGRKGQERRDRRAGGEA